MFGRKKHSHDRDDCAGCRLVFNEGKSRGALEERHRLEAAFVEEENNELKRAKAELTKARLKIDVYERMFSALRIPVLPKEGA